MPDKTSTDTTSKSTEKPPKEEKKVTTVSFNAGKKPITGKDSSKVDESDPIEKSLAERVKSGGSVTAVVDKSGKTTTKPTTE